MWVAVSGRNVVDAVSGASRTSYGTVTFLWNGTNVPGTVVTDGQYYVRVEMAWDDADNTLSSYPFTKGSTPFQSNPVNTANFLNVGITWTPLSTGLENGTIENQYFNVYPNPTKGLLKIDFKSPLPDCLLQVINESGKVVFNENISALTTGVREVDLTGLSDGVYYCTLRLPQRTFVFSIFKVK